MKKSKGFVFVETIVVIVVLIVGLVLIYNSFSSVLETEKRRATYNDVAYTYRTYYIEDYISSLNIEDFVEYYMIDQERELQEFTCNNTMLYNLKTDDNFSDVILNEENMSKSELVKESFCESLLNRLNIKHVYITNYNINELKKCTTRAGKISIDCDKSNEATYSKFEALYSMDTDAIYYLRTLSGTEDGYRMIVEYEETITDADDSVSKVVVNGVSKCPDSYEENAAGVCERKIVRNYFNNVKMYMKRELKKNEVVTAEKYTVTFNPNGGTVSPTSKEVYNGRQYGELPTPTISNGSSFDGWYTSASGGTKVNAIDIVNISSNITLYAHWNENWAKFSSGSIVNEDMKYLANNVRMNRTSIDENIKYFKRSSTLKNTSNNVATANSPKPIYIWYDNGTIYWYSDAKKVYLNEDSSNMFNNLSSVINIEVNDFDTSKVTDMSGMFESCSSLTSLDLSNFDTSNVLYMSKANTSYSYSSGGMFQDTLSLKSLNIKSFETSKVKNMAFMFKQSGLETIDLSHFDTSNVENMNYMFWYADAKSINLSGFENNKLTSTRYMFGDMKNIESLDLSSFNTSKLKNMDYMFSNMKNLKNLNLSNWNTENVSSMRYMFADCSSLKELNINHFNVQNVLDMKSMFERCLNIENLNLSNWVTTNVTDMSSMFHGLENLKSINIGNFKTNNVLNMSWMFFGDKNLTSLNVNSFNTEKVINMSAMFYGCSSLTSVNVSGFNTSNVTDMSSMFSKMSSLTSLSLNNFDTSKVTNMQGMFQELNGITNLDLSSFNTKNVDNMKGMFQYCSNLKTIYVSNNWTIDAITIENIYKGSSNMFYNDYKLVGGSGTKYNYSHTDKTYAHIDGGTSNPGYFTRK